MNDISGIDRKSRWTGLDNATYITRGKRGLAEKRTLRTSLVDYFGIGFNRGTGYSRLINRNRGGGGGW